LFSDSRLLALAIAAAAVALVPGRLAAQTSDVSPTSAREQDLPPKPLSRSWQVEYEFGVGAGLALGAGRAQGLPAPGPALSGFLGAPPSRQVHSWFFGDGAALLNEALAAGGRVARVVPMDAVLATQALDGRMVWRAGFRAVRGATDRFAIEVGLDFGPASYSLGQSTLAHVEEARASFAAAFGALFADPRFINPNVEATAAIQTASGYRANVTGALRMLLRVSGRVVPYLTLGGGGAFNFGDGPSIGLTGRYTFGAVGYGTRVWDEIDQLIVRFRPPTARALAVAGGGVSYELDRRHGIAIDGRLHISPDTPATLLEARPARATGSNAIVWTLTAPTVQFSTVGGMPSSLGLNLSGFSSHSGSTSTNAVLSIRYYVRY
jgi:hypothetical protein